MSRAKVLVVSARGRVFGLPLANLRETMRPQPIEPLPGALPGVLGVSLIRGESVPVVDLGVLLGGEASEAALTRFVTLKLAGGDVALAVSAVLGLRQLDSDLYAALPPLVGDAERALVEALAKRDARLMVVLNVARLLPDGVLA